MRVVSQEIERKQQSCEPLMKALKELDTRMDAVEASVATLDAETLHLASDLGLSISEGPKRP